MHFIYRINRLTTTKVDSTYLGSLSNNAQRICPVAGLERMTTGSAVSALPYLATQVDMNEMVACLPGKISVPLACILLRNLQHLFKSFVLYNS